MKRIILAFSIFIAFVFSATAQNIGDIVDINGVKAIVFNIDGDGHGTAMSVKALRGQKKAWCTEKRLADLVVADSETDGYANTRAVYDIIDAGYASPEDFPAFTWCRKLGEGWYIPAPAQLEKFVNFIMGNNIEYDWDDDSEQQLPEIDMDVINNKLIDAGGMPFLSSVAGALSVTGLFTSTKSTEGKVFVYQVNPEKNQWKFAKLPLINIGIYMNCRAFYDF